MVRKYKESDGECFAAVKRSDGCKILGNVDPECGTYKCPFYKPVEAASWVRLDLSRRVVLVPPDEYYGGKY